MNCLVTGGCGFVGSHIIRQLKQQGHTPICYDLYPNKTSIQEVLTPEELDELAIVQGGVDDRQVLVNVLKEYKIDRIIHLAGILGDKAEQDPAAAVETNILGTINMFEAALEVGIKRVVYTSSTSVFGTDEYYEPWFHGATIPNDVFLHPTLVYGATKMFLEFMGDWYYKNRGLETIGLRYTLVYGIARQRGSAQYVTECINKPAMGEPGVVENSDTVPDFIYVEDAARATIMATECPMTESKAFVIGGGQNSIHELRDYVLEFLPDANITLLPGVYPSSYKLDLEAAKREMGFVAEYSLKEGTRATINLLRAKQGLPPV